MPDRITEIIERLRETFPPYRRDVEAKLAHEATDRKHLFLTIELPSLYVDDIEGLREFAAPGESESDHILNRIGEPSGVKLTTEINGEKDSDVISVWGMVRSAEVGEANRGYGANPHLTEDEVKDKWAAHLEGEPDELLRATMDRFREMGIADDEIADELRRELRRIERKTALTAALHQARGGEDRG